MSRRVLVPHLAQAPIRPLAGALLLRAQGRTMGTTWDVRWVTGSGASDGSTAAGATGRMQAEIQARLHEVVVQMSTWEPDSDLSRFNRAPADTRVELPGAFSRVLEQALAVARDSGGAFDPTAGALVDAWGFGPDGPGGPGGPGGSCGDSAFRLPGREALAAARSRGGWSRLAFDADARTAVQPGGMRLDLSAIAKGFAVDEVARHLQSQGIASYLVEVGGELRGDGVKPDGQPWWVALETPAATDECEHSDTIVALCNLSIATSGDYRRYFDRDGVRYCHAIDPRTGCPVSAGTASVTVLHADCMAADAFSTALMVMGPEQGIGWAERRGLAALFRLRGSSSDGAGRLGTLTERMTARFAELLQ
jgi:thiamine biosynthesis lipoprotein